MIDQTYTFDLTCTVYHPAAMATTSSDLYPPQDGDFVIQTNDAVFFGVHRLLLRLVSPVMNDMFALGAMSRDQTTPGAFRLFCIVQRDNLSDYFFRGIVPISEDSGTFQNLLSFIYPDKPSPAFTTLDVLLPVLSAANKYQMNAVLDALKIQIMSKSISGNTHREALLYSDPLKVYREAKKLDLGDLADAAANATLCIDISAVPDPRSDLASMPAIWLWQLLNLRKERSAWLLQKCGSGFLIANMNENYKSTGRGFGIFPGNRCGCGEGEMTTRKLIPATLLDTIKAYPCARAIRKIDFNVTLKCLRCGAAAAAHFNKICNEYEKAFGIF